MANIQRKTEPHCCTIVIAKEITVVVLEPELRVPVVRRACLIAMKKAAGRPQDLLDVAQLTAGADDEEE